MIAWENLVQSQILTVFTSSLAGSLASAVIDAPLQGDFMFLGHAAPGQAALAGDWMSRQSSKNGWSV